MTYDKFPRLERTNEPKWLDPKEGVNLWSLPDIFPTVRFLFYLNAAHPEAISAKDVNFHFGWDARYFRNIVRKLNEFGYIEITKLPNKRIYFKGSRRYKLSRRGFEAVQDLLKEGTAPIFLEKVPA